MGTVMFLSQIVTGWGGSAITCTDPISLQATWALVVMEVLSV